MSITEYIAASPGSGFAPAERVPPKRSLHRIRRVRRQQGLSRRTLARRLKVSIGHVVSQEHETSDLLLSTLYQWQKALGVPIEELLVEGSGQLSAPVLRRARMVRLMKTAKAICERARQSSIQRMATMLIQQLVELMPELEEVKPWHAVGQRRTSDEVGQAGQVRLSQ